MNKLLIGLGLTLMVLIFLYAAMASLVNQGLSAFGAAFMLILVVSGGAGLLWILRK